MMQLSKFVLQSQAEVIAAMLRQDGAMRLYEGDQPELAVRTEGRLCSCPISSAVVSGGTLTITWDSATAVKEGRADYYRMVTGNIPVMGGTIGEEMEMADREIKVGTIIDSGVLVHNVFGRLA